MSTNPNTTGKSSLTATVEVNTPIEKVWKLWNTPADIMQWNKMSEDWHTPYAENDLRPGGKFLYVMGLKDGSFKFDFKGVYDEVKTNCLISYTLNDNRKSIITFSGDNPVRITETFEPEDNLPAEEQQGYCQAVLNVFKRYAESHIDTK
ncbi:SRPBCC domain-containing protein [Mucilaginibacter agri]|uniref:Polyketide cyclase n=1 Tax=Mucilaginibacter agri TaxID=2695265 RepID=A0A965ZKE9_9SPHI|nr:SRPBCC domain-containing protein [Mucilaginibacter agri]NCD72320.1 polyketide cyclase [Mucilaginibacter agri]